MWTSLIILVVCATVYGKRPPGKGPNKCDLPEPRDGDFFPKFPITFGVLNNVILEGENTSRVYYEIFSLNPKNSSAPIQLPILRKLVVRWVNDNGAHSYDIAGYNPGTAVCENHNLSLSGSGNETQSVMFNFTINFPGPEHYTGTIFTSCPERYYINWYCPTSQLIEKDERKFCLYNNLRMSIFSPDGPHHLPMHLIVKDLHENDAPTMDDLRWTMTFDAPEICPIEDNEVVLER